MRSPRLVLGFLALALPTLAQEDLGPPDWSRSTLECPATVRERDLLPCTLTLRRGAKDRFTEPAGADWRLTLPGKALFWEASAGGAFDPEWRHVVGQTSVAPGGEAAVSIVLLAGPESDGTRLTIGASIAGPEPVHVSATTEVAARRQPGELVSLGGVNLTPAGAWVLGFLGTGPLFLGACVLLGGARSGVLGLAVAAWIAAGFLLLFGALARHDLRLLREYREAACVVTDTGQHTRASGKGRHATTFAEPFVALRFEVGGRLAHGTGFDSGSHLRRGANWPPRELQSFEPGAEVPCWYDPEDPAQAIVVRGPGGAYLFALLPLGLLALVARPLGRALRRGRRTAPARAQRGFST